MRDPNPPAVMLDNLTPDQQRKVIRLALLIVAQLASGSDWGAFEIIEGEPLELEEKMGLWSLLNSQQRATIKSMSEASRVDFRKEG